MKQIIAALLLASTLSFSQTIIYKNHLSLENSIKKDSGSRIYFNNNLFSSEIHRKSAGLAIIYSLLLPGMGELYAGSYSSGKYFTIAEAALWGMYFSFNTYSNWKRDKYIEYATYKAGVNPQGKGIKYYGIIGDYMNINDYNNSKARERNFSTMYSTNQYYWKWNSTRDRKSYRNLWTTSEVSHNALRFIIGGLILNRIASVINAVRLVTRYNKGINSETTWNISAGVSKPANLPYGIVVNFQTEF